VPREKSGRNKGRPRLLSLGEKIDIVLGAKKYKKRGCLRGESKIEEFSKKCGYSVGAIKKWKSEFKQERNKDYFVLEMDIEIGIKGKSKFELNKN
jgi:hypothetical protein